MIIGNWNRYILITPMDGIEIANHHWMDEYNWHERLLDDPEYLRRYADKWFHLRETVLSDASIESSIDKNLHLLIKVLLIKKLFTLGYSQFLCGLRVGKRRR